MSDSKNQRREAQVLPSSSVAGFFQERPCLENQFYDDAALRRVFSSYLPSQVQNDTTHDLSRFGKRVLSDQVLTWVADAERNPPYLKTWDTWGKRRDELVTSEGWRQLQDLGISEGIVAIPYENDFAEYSRAVQFVKYHLWTGSCAYVTCPAAMTDGAARLLSSNFTTAEPASRRVFESAYRRLTLRDPRQAWTSGQWMTERAGGSDVSETQTLAHPSSSITGTGVNGAQLGPWSIDGFKWFSSATDSSMAVLLARTPNGISAFYAPMRRKNESSPEPETELNGIRIQRLKSKLGTRALPTAELELQDMRAWMIGQEGQGIKQISTILNITRVHTAVTAVGLWGRGLAISRAFARVRKTRGKALIDTPAHVRTMATQHVDYRAMMHLAHFTTLLLGVSEQPHEKGIFAVASNPALPAMPYSQAQLLLRLTTPIAKALTAKAGIRGLAECMESLGGVGYLENEEMEFNIARLFRDANVLSIWEGTTDIMALDIIRVVTAKTGPLALDALDCWISQLLKLASSTHKLGLHDESSTIQHLWGDIKHRIQDRPESLSLSRRELMYALGRVICGVLLIVDYTRDGDEAAGEISRRWLAKASEDGQTLMSSPTSMQETIEWDRKIVFGDVPPATAKL